MTAVEIIDSILNTETIADLGVIATVAKNISINHGVEPALTYLLGAMDSAAASNNFKLTDLLRETRTALKREFRDKCPDALLPDGPICPKCGGRRGPSGIDGGSWVHY